MRLGGLQLGGLPATSLGGVTTQNAGLQVSQHGGGVLLLGTLRLPQPLQAGGLQLGKTTGSLGSGLQMGQLGGLQTGGLQIGQQTAGQQLNSGQIGQGGGLKLGPTSQAGLGTQSSGLQLGLGGLTAPQQVGLQLGGLKGSLQAGQTVPVTNGLQLGTTTHPSTGMHVSFVPYTCHSITHCDCV